MRDDLKPCPFCGGEVEPFIGPFAKSWMFVCHRCGADVCFYGAERSRQLSVAAWNRRAEQ